MVLKVKMVFLFLFRYYIPFIYTTLFLKIVFLLADGDDEMNVEASYDVELEESETAHASTSHDDATGK